MDFEYDASTDSENWDDASWVPEFAAAFEEMLAWIKGTPGVVLPKTVLDVKIGPYDAGTEVYWTKGGWSRLIFPTKVSASIYDDPIMYIPTGLRRASCKIPGLFLHNVVCRHGLVVTYYAEPYNGFRAYPPTVLNSNAFDRLACFYGNPMRRRCFFGMSTDFLEALGTALITEPQKYVSLAGVNVVVEACREKKDFPQWLLDTVECWNPLRRAWIRLAIMSSRRL